MSDSKRDQFYHTCWLRLFSERPDLMQYLVELELRVAGLALFDPLADNEPEKEARPV